MMSNALPLDRENGISRSGHTGIYEVEVVLGWMQKSEKESAWITFSFLDTVSATFEL